MKKVAAVLSILTFMCVLLLQQLTYAQRGITVKQALGFTAVNSGIASITINIGGFQEITSISNYDTENTVSLLSETGIGFKFNSIFSFDISFLYFCPKFKLIDNINRVDSFAKTKSYVFLLNGYINFLALFHKHFRFFDPYIGFGAGVSRNKISNTNVFQEGRQLAYIAGNRESDFAYRFIAGLNFHITKQLLAFLQYDYLRAGNFKTGNSGVNFSPEAPIKVLSESQINNYNNQLVLGLLYVFKS